MARPRNLRKEQEMRTVLTQDYLKLVLDYNPETGVLMRKAAGKYQAHLINKPFGCIDSNGYIKGMLEGFQTYGHILIWVLIYGKWPLGEIDHIDQDRNNNRLSNLREVTTAIQQKNARKSVRNQSGYTGVSFCPSGPGTKCYKATTTVNGKQHHHGYFETAEEANVARQRWIQENPEAGFTVRHGQ